MEKELWSRLAKPLQITHDRKIQESKCLLTFANLSTSEICYELGFNDFAYFHDSSKNTGLTTQQYRCENQ